MSWLIALMGLSVAATLLAGVWLEMHPRRLPSPRWLKGGVFGNFLVFGLALAAFLYLGVQDVMAQEAAATHGSGISMAVGLALIGIGLPTGLAAIGAGIALGPVSAAALAVITEKPEMFGRALIYIGLAEGIAIYGLVMSILLLGKL
jgi:V/A-type H+-transporting ATPase subunit K